jgi:hypothetical protein
MVAHKLASAAYFYKLSFHWPIKQDHEPPRFFLCASNRGKANGLGLQNTLVSPSRSPMKRSLSPSGRVSSSSFRRPSKQNLNPQWRTSTRVSRGYPCWNSPSPLCYAHAEEGWSLIPTVMPRGCR